MPSNVHLTHQKVEEIFRGSGAIREGHFLLTSGLHSPSYWEKFQVLQYPQYTERLCGMIARRYRDQGIQIVAGPTTGGIIIAFEVARQLGVRGIFAERQGEERAFRRGFNIAAGEHVLIVDDILTTGSSIRQVIAEVKRKGGDVVGLGVLVDRSSEGVDLEAPLFSCLRVPVVTYKPEECPLCAAGIPLDKPGSSQTGIETA